MLIFMCDVLNAESFYVQESDLGGKGLIGDRGNLWNNYIYI